VVVGYKGSRTGSSAGGGRKRRTRENCKKMAQKRVKICSYNISAHRATPLRRWSVSRPLRTRNRAFPRRTTEEGKASKVAHRPLPPHRSFRAFRNTSLVSPTRSFCLLVRLRPHRHLQRLPMVATRFLPLDALRTRPVALMRVSERTYEPPCLFGERNC
jgi:hypothetical protein